MIGRGRSDPIRVKSIETPVTDHCNLKCAGCDHISPHITVKYVEANQLAADLSVLRRAMRADEFRLVGGEPLQHPQLNAVLDAIRESAIAERIVLVTNGLLLYRADPHVWRSIDKLWLSVYPGVRLALSLDQIRAKCEANNVVFDPRPTNQFRRVVLSQAIADSDLVQSIYDDCKAAHQWKCYTVAKGRFFKCTKPALVKERLALVGTKYEETLPDGVDLHSGWFLRSRLRRYLESKAPLSACRYCLGTAGPSFDHHQMNRQELAGELAADQAGMVASVRAKLRAQSRQDRRPGKSRPPAKSKPPKGKPRPLGKQPSDGSSLNA
jgi:organic radical activating enzyme